MDGHTRRVVRVGALLGVLALLLGALHAARLSFNFTDSMPIGIYRLDGVTRPVRAGDVVEVCPPPDAARLAMTRHYLLRNGPCPYGAIYLLKMVAAVGGDTVDVERNRVLVNGVALANSATLALDRQGKPLPHVSRGIYHLGPGQLWLWTPNPRSWDSRYYGPVAERGVAGFAHLVLAVAPWPYFNVRRAR
ncbi:MAG TPA: conjugative transfer signal peptidase TraF [Candidatus Limnocylindria bacterium]|nr:conjugative transfer signal peptidase TraF [Candidatus Limnocylindria bacterium]